ncbi:UNVERIFIED_CONTAM: hypothetical protein PYX00_008171 [Menopon gallinae]|uniref:Chitin-binding type-2 domain-containing protein n=1 Tax=Menopon gallinae TaxID=328185 RepID=A0AAW2HML5_9NEOP
MKCSRLIIDKISRGYIYIDVIRMHNAVERERDSQVNEQVKMKTVIALVVLTAAVVLANRPAGPFGTCPPVDGPTSVYLPDLKNRTVFYQCSNGKPVLMFCRESLVFTTSWNICERPCTTCSPDKPIGYCPTVDGQRPVNLRDGANVATYYTCQKGKPVLRTCAAGTIFEPYREICVREN